MYRNRLETSIWDLSRTGFYNQGIVAPWNVLKICYFDWTNCSVHGTLLPSSLLIGGWSFATIPLRKLEGHPQILLYSLLRISGYTTTWLWSQIGTWFQ